MRRKPVALAPGPPGLTTRLPSRSPVARRRTTLVVAHRLTTAARADRVAVLAHGRLVEIGPHAELLAAGGAYAALWAAFTADEDADPLMD